MKDKARRLLVRIAVFSIVILIAIPCFYLLYLQSDHSLSALKTYFSSSFVNSEIVYLILALAIVLLLALGLLFLSVIVTTKPIRKRYGWKSESATTLMPAIPVANQRRT